ncbi:hypothetical protein [Methylobacterium oryzisoli]|uniref:hypothetical protein n=1 Tax=Methylobacterium oryzisoli TaxID=3385502 RepID=UPI003891E8E8
MSNTATLTDRLRGIYRIPITDGLGATGGGEEPDNPHAFVRHFETPPIQKEAAREIERLRAGIRAYLDGDYEHPRRHRPGKCAHGAYYYEECGSCIDAHFTALLSGNSAQDRNPGS